MDGKETVVINLSLQVDEIKKLRAQQFQIEAQAQILSTVIEAAKHSALPPDLLTESLIRAVKLISAQ